MINIGNTHMLGGIAVKIEEIRTGCIRIWLSDEDMARYGITYRDMAQGEERTDRMLRRILAVVAQYTGHASARYTVEALDTGEGCLLLVTASAYTLAAEPPFVCAVTEPQRLFRLAADWCATQTAAYSELYVTPHGYIVVIHPDCGNASAQLQRLRRYADRVECGQAAAAAAAEYGTLTSQGDVLQRLAVTVSAPPAPAQPEILH